MPSYAFGIGRRWFSTAMFVFCTLLLVFLLSNLTSPAAADVGTATLTIAKETIPDDSETWFPFTIVGHVGGWGSYGSETGQFNQPVDVSVDTAGNVYVADNHNQRVQKFDPSGTYLLAELTGYYPSGVAVDADGNIFVLEYHGLAKYDSNGVFVTRQSMGIGFSGDAAIDSAGNIYVAYGDRIEKRDNNLALLTQWGASGSGDGEFNEASGVALDSAGLVYVADRNNHRIQKFHPDGLYLDQWGSITTGFNQPSDVAVDAADNVYVADSSNHRIQKFDVNGTYLTSWGSYGSGPGQFNQPAGVTVDAAGHVYVADRLNHRIQKFVDYATTLNDGGSAVYDALEAGTYTIRETLPDGWTVDDITCSEAGDNWNNWQKGVNKATATLAANEHVTCTFNNTKLAPPQATGKLTLAKETIPDDSETWFPFTIVGHVGGWGSYGSETGQFNQPVDVSVDTAGNVYVADNHNQRVQKFDPSGTYLLAELTGYYPSGVAVDADGNIFVLEYHGLAKYDSNGVFVTRQSMGIGFSGDAAIDSAGNIYVAYGDRIEKRDNNLALLTQWGASGSGDGEFNEPVGWPWTARALSMWLTATTTASKSSIPMGSTSTSGAVSLLDSTSPLTWPWTRRTMSMLPTAAITAFRNLTSMGPT